MLLVHVTSRERLAKFRQNRRIVRTHLGAKREKVRLTGDVIALSTLELLYSPRQSVLSLGCLSRRRVIKGGP
jgi:hypothetical protein